MEDFSENEDDDEEDDESDDEETKRPRKKRKKKGHGFILDEAEVDDDVEEDDEWEEGADEIIDTNKFTEQSRARELDSHRRLQKMFSDQREDEIEQYYRNKYAEQQSERMLDQEGELPDEIAQHALQPGVKDPNLWMVKCRIGEEKSTVLQLMRKFIAHQNSDQPMEFKSAVAPEGIKGYIYIEAYKQAHVKQAIEGIGSLKIGMYKQHMIPIKEMTDVLRVTKDQAVIRTKQWVRLKRGIYKDDLAQVDYVDQASGTVTLKLIPRIDYTRMRGALKDSMGENNKRKFGKRPVAKLFNPEAIRNIGGEITSDGDFQIFEGNRYRRGFLYKVFQISALMIDGVKPSLSELAKFEEQSESADIADTYVAEGKGHSFAPGDNVIVIEGELAHLQGKITAIDGDKITMLPKHEDLKEPLDFQAHELKKYFKEGDHVKIIAGQYEGDTGLIVRVDEKEIAMLSDLTMHEVKILPKDCQICSDTATGVDSLGQFQLGDLVQVDAKTVGVIVRLEKENFQILKTDNTVAHVRHQAVSRKRDSRRAVGLDSEQNQISVKDQVKVIDGPLIGFVGEIKHIYREFSFVHSRQIMENGGMAVVKNRNLLICGGSKNSFVASDLASMGYMSPRITSPRHPSSGGPGGGGGGGGGGNMRSSFMPNRSGRAREDMELIGKTIKIIKGTYKGYVGIVKDAVGMTARVELHSSCQTISVDKSRIAVVSAETGQRMGAVSSYNPAQTPMSMYGSQTPLPSGSRTPGSQTPMYETGSRTPRPDGSRTPVYDPSKTPIHQSSVWDPSASATPRPEYDDYSEPSPSPSFHNPPTPGYHNPDTPQGPFTPQTPGNLYSSASHDPYYSQASPGMSLSAPSPASNYLASPSPAGYGQSGPSPAGYSAFSPMTPGGSGGPGSVQSPMAYNPHTPGAGMMDNYGSWQDWQTPDIEVRIKASHDDTDLIGQSGIIRGISGGMSTVFLPNEDRTVNIISHHLEPIRPITGDYVKVILGEQDREATGKVLSIDGNDAVVELEGIISAKLINVNYLCKMKPS